ncbi:Protein disulfide-isomerase [Dirofilaria immitis]|nr:Protein disulfide-isomerase [Dirofilaria immitis]
MTVNLVVGYNGDNDEMTYTEPYSGGREVDDFIKYIAKHATEELKGYKRDGKPKKKEELSWWGKSYMQLKVSRLEYLAFPTSITSGFCVALRLAFCVLHFCSGDVGSGGNSSYGFLEVSNEIYGILA